MKHPNKSYLSAVVMTVFLAMFAVFIPQSKALTSLTNGIVAYWPMDQISSGVLTPDLGPNGFDLKPYFSSSTAATTNFNGSNVTQVGAGNGPHSGFPNAQNGTNCFALNLNQKTTLGYISSGYPGLMPPTVLTNYTISFWVQGTNITANEGNRVLGVGDTTGGNGLWDMSFDPGGTAEYDHFRRQGNSFAGGVQYGNFSGGQHQVGTNALFADTTWHNITIVHQVITNMTLPVVAPTNIAPVAGAVTLSWSSIALDAQFPNWTNQVDTNQNYLVQRSTDISSPANWVTIGTVVSLGTPGPTTFTDNSPPYPNAFYRVIQPRVRYATQTLYMDVSNVDNNFQTEPVPNGANFLAPYGAWHQNAFAFGGIIRGSPTGWSTVNVGDAAIWSRALSLAEITAYRNDGITNIGGLSPPLSALLQGEFIAAVTNDTDGMIWTASKPPATLAFNPGNVNVTPQSILGSGSTNALVFSNTTFQIVASHAGLSLTSSVPVIGVSNIVNGNWHYIEDFTYETVGAISGQGNAGQGGWLNPANGPVSVGMGVLAITNSSVDGNNSVFFDANVTGALAGIKLKSLSVSLNASNTFFFRFYIDPLANQPDPNLGGDDPNIDEAIALTDQGIRDVVDLDAAGNIGIRLFRNNPVNGGVAGPIDLQCVNGPAAMALTPGGYNWLTDSNSNPTGASLDVGHVYNVWVDVQDLPKNVGGGYGSGGVQTNGDLFRVWLQEDSWGARSNLFSEFTQDSTNQPGGNASLDFPHGWLVSNRDYSAADVTFPQTDPLSTLYLVEVPTMTDTELETNMVRYDDFYLSKVGLEPTKPATAHSLAR